MQKVGDYMILREELVELDCGGEGVYVESHFRRGSSLSRVRDGGMLEACQLSCFSRRQCLQFKAERC